MAVKRNESKVTQLNGLGLFVFELVNEDKAFLFCTKNLLVFGLVLSARF